MYLFEDVNEWKEFKCQICKQIFKSWKALSKHIQQQPGTHFDLNEYKRKYFPKGYWSGVPPKNYMTYILCNPLKKVILIME